MKTQVQPYFQRNLVAPLPTPSDIAEYPTQLAPLLVDALLTRRNRSFWATDSDHEAGLQAINLYLIGVLMGAKRDLIIEIRGIRGRTGETLADVDPDVVPVGLYSGIQLNDIVEKLGTELGVQIDTELLAVNEKLQLLVEAAQTPEDQTAILEILGNILLALA